MSLIGVRSIELGSTKAFPGPKRQMVASNLVIIPYKVANYRRFITIYCIITLTVSLSASEASYFLISQAFKVISLLFICVFTVQCKGNHMEDERRCSVVPWYASHAHCRLV